VQTFRDDRFPRLGLPRSPGPSRRHLGELGAPFVPDLNTLNLLDLKSLFVMYTKCSYPTCSSQRRGSRPYTLSSTSIQSTVTIAPGQLVAHLHDFLTTESIITSRSNYSLHFKPSLPLKSLPQTTYLVAIDNFRFELVPIALQADALGRPTKRPGCSLFPGASHAKTLNGGDCTIGRELRH
jgi:hypothetical protein